MTVVCSNLLLDGISVAIWISREFQFQLCYANPAFSLRHNIKLQDASLDKGVAKKRVTSKK